MRSRLARSMLVASVLAAGARAQTFDPPLQIAFGASDVVFAKVDGDAWRDLVGRRGTRLVVALGGEGGLRAPRETDLGVSGRLVLADFDGDGSLDALVLGDPAGTCRLALGDGRGGFTLRAPFAGGSPIAGARSDPWVFDHGGDGDLDVLQFQTLYENDGRGAFLVRPVPEVASGGVFGLADVDGDGALDALSRERARPERFWIARAVGTSFAPPDVLVYPGTPTFGPAFVDADGDGWIDVVSAGSQGVALHYGRAGGFEPAALHVAARLDGSFASADLDGDGRLDLAFGVRGGATQVLWQFAPRAFAALPAYASSASQADALCVLDADDDGLLDLLGFAGSEVTLAHGTGGLGFRVERTAIAPATSLAIVDLDRDGDADVWLSAPTGGSGAGASELLVNRTDPAFRRLGSGTPGLSGQAPRVQARGGWPRIGNTGFSVLFDKLDPGMLGLVVGSIQGGSLPFGNGTLHVVPPFAFLWTTTTGGQFGLPASGRITLDLPIDPSLTLPQPDLFLQLVVLDLARSATTLSPGARVRLVE